MTDITELVKRLRAPELWARHGRDGYWSDGTPFEAADALEAQAKEIKIYQQTELTYVTRVADAQREYFEMQARLKARIAELDAALEKISDTDPDDGTAWFHEVARAALSGEKR